MPTITNARSSAGAAPHPASPAAAKMERRWLCCARRWVCRTRCWGQAPSGGSPRGEQSCAGAPAPRAAAPAEAGYVPQRLCAPRPLQAPLKPQHTARGWLCPAASGPPAKRIFCTVRLCLKPQPPTPSAIATRKNVPRPKILNMQRGQRQIEIQIHTRCCFLVPASVGMEYIPSVLARKG